MDNMTRIIAAGVGPIIVISACGLLCLAFYNRLAAVVSRLRAFHREQLAAQDALARCRAAGDEEDAALVRCQETLGMLHLQIERVMRRCRLLRATLACLLLTIALLAACSLAVGLSAVFPAAAYAAVPLFVLGLILLIAGVALALMELGAAIDPVDMEGRFVRELGEDLSDAADGTVPERASFNASRIR